MPRRNVPHVCVRAKFQPISEESVCVRDIGQGLDQGLGSQTYLCAWLRFDACCFCSCAWLIGCSILLWKTLPKPGVPGPRVALRVPTEWARLRLRVQRCLGGRHVRSTSY